MKINLHRSQQWLRAQRLAKGENVPDKIEAEISPALLCEANRAALLDMSFGDTYPDHLRYITFNREFVPSSGTTYGSEYITVDADQPTSQEIDAALSRAFESIAACKAEKDAKEAASVAEANRKIEARLLLADEFAKLNERIDSLTKNRDDICRDRKILAEFLASFPDDALVGALKAYAKGKIEEVQKEIEDASPVTIFNDTGDI